MLNAGPFQKRNELSTQDFGFTSVTSEACPDGMLSHSHKTLKRRGTITRGLNRRQSMVISPGYGTAGKADCPYFAIPFKRAELKKIVTLGRFWHRWRRYPSF